MFAVNDCKEAKIFFSNERSDEPVAYSYRTIFYGFNASSFILYYVFKHHASCYSDNDSSCFLHSSFYVDGLIVAVDFFTNVYVESMPCKKACEFCLHLFSSNSAELHCTMQKDEHLVAHDNDYEKVIIEDDAIYL